jgi:nucleotide-binding universal stress UspA family protein
MANDIVIPAPISPLLIRQALIGWSSEESDRSILDYVGMISKWAPIESAFLLHVVSRFEDLAPDAPEATGQELGAAWVRSMRRAVENHVEAADRIFWEFEVREGQVADELALTAIDLQADLVCIGRMEHASLAPELVRVVPRSLLVVPPFFRPSIGKVLVAVDFSEPSARALRQACALAARQERPASITCLHFYELPQPKYLAGTIALNDLAREMHIQREKAFQVFLERHLPETQFSVSPEIHPARAGEIATALSRYAREERFDLVVLGAGSHSEAEQIKAGMVAEAFIRHTPDIALWMVR